MCRDPETGAKLGVSLGIQRRGEATALPEGRRCSICSAADAPSAALSAAEAVASQGKFSLAFLVPRRLGDGQAGMRKNETAAGGRRHFTHA